MLKYLPMIPEPSIPAVSTCRFFLSQDVLQSMSRQILVPVDGSPKSMEGLEYALSTYGDETITVFHVMTPHGVLNPDIDLSDQAFDDWRVASREEAERIFDHARDLADEHDTAVSTAVDIGEPWRAIVHYAERNNVDHIIMGSHGREDDSPLPLGSVAETVMRRSPVLVSIVR